MPISRLILSILLLVVTEGIVVLSPKIRHFITKRFSLIFLFVFIFGFIVYVIGYYRAVGENVFVSTFLALTSTLQMFAFGSDLYELTTDPASASVPFVISYAVVHILALTLSVTFILDLFGKRLVSRIEMMLISWKKKKSPVCIIGGTDKNSLALAKSLIDDPSVVDPVIIFINSIVDSKAKSFSLEDLLDSSSVNDASDQAKAIGHVISTTASLSETLTRPDNWLCQSIIRLLRRNEDSRVFLLSSDSKQNADAAYSLALSLGDNTGTQIYAGIHPNSPDAHRLLDFKYVTLISKSELTVRGLMSNTPILSEGKCKPTLLVGFGHTGKSALVALAKEGFKEIDVASFSKEYRKEEFLCFNPQLRGMDGIHYMDSVVNSDAYWTYLRENIDRLCNIIIFTQEDASSYKAGARILEYAHSARKDMNDFRVYIMTPQSEIVPKESCMFTFGEIESTYTFKLF